MLFRELRFDTKRSGGFPIIEKMMYHYFSICELNCAKRLHLLSPIVVYKIKYIYTPENVSILTDVKKSQSLLGKSFGLCGLLTKEGSPLVFKKFKKIKTLKNIYYEFQLYF